jgi:hypothetical protein
LLFIRKDLLTIIIKNLEEETTEATHGTRQLSPRDPINSKNEVDHELPHNLKITVSVHNETQAAGQIVANSVNEAPLPGPILNCKIFLLDYFFFFLKIYLKLTCNFARANLVVNVQVNFKTDCLVLLEEKNSNLI